MTRKKKTTAQYSALTGIHRAIPIILFAFAVFTMFCFITQDIGALGHAISALFLGLFSHGAYAIPLLLALHAIFYSSDIAGKRVVSRVIFSLIAITFISALSYSITYWDSGFTFNAVEFFRNGKNAVGGGLIGGTVGFCITQIVGKVGLVTIAAAILAIYVSYFFAGGQSGLKTVFRGIVHFILVVLAKIERTVKRINRKMKNAKTEKVKRNTNMKSLELADDDYFDEDNGMSKVNIPALGIKITRSEASINANITLQDKLFHKSAVSKEEAEEMERREQCEEMYARAMADAPVEDAEPIVTPRKRTATYNYDVWEYDGDDVTDSKTANDAENDAENTESAAKPRDESADSVFTKDFDPFVMAMSEKLASKPSSRSLLKEKQNQTRITEDVSELTEAEIEREKRILEFERRKAAIISNHRPTPVNNDGEFKGTPKTVDFRERKEETVAATPRETEVSSFTFDKSARVYEQPKPEPAHYTAIGIGVEGDSFSTVVKKQPSQNAYSTQTPPTYNADRAVNNTPYGTAANTTAGNPTLGNADNKYAAGSAFGNDNRNTQSTAFGNGYSNAASQNMDNAPYREQTVGQNPSFGKPYEDNEATVIFSKKTTDSVYSGANDSNPTVYERVEPNTDKKEEKASSTEFYNMDHSGDDGILFTFSTEKKADVKAAEPIASTAQVKAETDKTVATVNTSATEEATKNPITGGYYTTDKNEDTSVKIEFVPEFKPYQPPTDNDVSREEVNVIRLDEGESQNLGTIKVEREMIKDDITEDIYAGLDDEDEMYADLDDGDEEEYEDGEIDESAFEDDGAAFETEEIPESERNPVVQGYKDMFTALHDDNVSKDIEQAESTESDNSTDTADESNDSDDSTDGEDESGEAYDTDGEDDSAPPFAHTRIVPESKAASAKEPAEKEEKAVKAKPDFSNYKFPPIDLLTLDPAVEDDTSEIQVNTGILIDTLASFGVTASIKGVDRGPRITRYEVVPARGVKVSAVTKLYNDIVLALGKEGVRMEAPIPGKSAIGFEIPNENPKTVRLRELLESDEFKNPNSPTFIAVGKDVAGGAVFDDVRKYPHALVCGATGTGKSVFINSLLISMLYHAHPDDLKLIMIDPKIVEFTMYVDIPHLLIPVINDAKQAAGALIWAVEEMERRYALLNEKKVRNIDSYNEKVKFDPSLGEPLSKIVIVIDELADLMMQAKQTANTVEDQIARLAQKARAAGIHLLLGTQRPDVKVITGKIKANIPTRIACKVTSQIDSRTIFDESGAEKLLGKGDMLYWPGDKGAALRVQGAFVSDTEVEDVMNFLKSQSPTKTYDDEVFAAINKKANDLSKDTSGGSDDDEDAGEVGGGCYSDPQFLDAVELAIRSKKISTSLLQRKLSIGYGKAAKYIDTMQEIGVVSEPNGQKPRDVLISMDDWHEKLSRVALD